MASQGGAPPGGEKPPGEEGQEPAEVGDRGSISLDGEVGQVITPVAVSAKRERLVKDVQVRGMLAGALIAIFALTIMAALLVAALADEQQVKSMRSLLDVLLPAETGLLGSAVGYYYGARG
jgi:hypothetical protein